MTNMNSGYTGYSMSNRAVEAYDSGARPISKWTKTDMMDEIESIINELNVDWTMKDMKALKVKALRNLVLSYDSWHHTSSYCNNTDFYRIDPERIEGITLADIEDAKAKQNAKKEEPKEKRVRAEFLVWSGTRKHPKAERREAEGVIRGNWFYLSNGSRKSINAKGFEILEVL